MLADAELRFEALPAGSIDRDYVPKDEADLLRCLGDPFWRIESGQLYKITVKKADGDALVPFRPNRAQRRFLRRMWHRNVILKARQLGFTTLISILWLDHALFNAHQLCVQVAHTRDASRDIFRNKVLVAYDNLPQALREAKYLVRRDTATEIEICNGSVVRVTTSPRGGTPHRLHISEMGKIGAKFPDKSREIVSGGFPAVPMDGVIVVESTAEGQDGDFKDIVDKAQEQHQLGKPLNPKQFRFHFYPWWEDPAYRLSPTDAAHVVITESDEQYFESVEARMGIELDHGQRAWWITTFESECLCDLEMMWREFPSTPEEPFKVGVDGTFYAEQLRRARESGRIGHYPYLDGHVVNTFWDIGSGDGTAIWLHQHVNGMDRFFAFIEAWDKPYSHFISELQKVGVEHSISWGVHYLPHDAEAKHQQAEVVASPMDELKNLKGIGGKWTAVPRVLELIHGINATRKAFSRYCFDERGCKAGLDHVTAYRKKWDRNTGRWGDEPVKRTGHSEAADALRQHAQGFKPKSFRDDDDDRPGRRERNHRVL